MGQKLAKDHMITSRISFIIQDQIPHFKDSSWGKIGGLIAAKYKHAHVLKGFPGVS